MALGLKGALTHKVQQYSLPILTDASGNFVGTIEVNGLIRKVAVLIGTLTSGVADVTFTDSDTLETIHAATNITANYAAYPKVQNVNAANSAITGEYIEPVVSTAKITVAQGGNITAGTAYVYVDR